MSSFRYAQELQDQKAHVRLQDGRRGKILRIETIFPENKTEVSVFTPSERGPDITKVALESLSADRSL